MTDSQKDNVEDTLESTSSLDDTTGANPAPDAEQVEPAETSKPNLYPKPTPSSEEIDESKPPVVLTEPIEARSEPTPTPVKVAMAPKAKPAATETMGSPATDSSISIDGDSSPNVGALIIDAIAAAVAIAFTVLLVQDVIPFL